MTSDIETLDARRLLCPLPVIRCQDRVAEMAVGSRLKIICSDPGAMYDVPAWCRINGHIVVDAEEIDDEYVITVEVGETV